MTYAIVSSHLTGNTYELATALKSALPGRQCFYFGEPEQEACEADIILLGFWTDQGACDARAADFMRRIHRKQIALFGTAGFGGAQDYFDEIIKKARTNLSDDNTFLGSFMCQGKMKPEVRSKYEQMLAKDPGNSQAKMLIDNFDAALSHPNQDDLQNVISFAKHILKIK